MATVPTPTVRLDDGTGTFPFDITSKILSLNGYGITRGREDWIGSVTAGELTLKLNNSDGRFTPGSTILGTPSPIKVDQRIRVTESVGVSGFGLGGFGVGGFGDTGLVNRFTGYVKSWPVSWPATVSTFAEVELTATDAQARAERRTLRSMLEEEILLNSPGLYYELTEEAGANSAADSSGNQQPTIVPRLGTIYAFGGSIGLPGVGTGLQFTGLGSSTNDGAFRPLANDASFTSSNVCITFALLTSTVGPNPSAPPFITWGPVSVGFSGGGSTASIDNTGSVQWCGTSSPAPVTDGIPHIITVQGGGGGTSDIWVDGVKVASGGAVTGSWIAGGDGVFKILGNPVAGATSVIGQASVGPRIADANVAAIHAAALGSTQSGVQRITRLAAYAGVPLGTLDTSLTTVAAQDTSGVSAWDALQEAADAELGLVFVDGSGSLAFHNRNRVASKTTPDLTLDSQYITPDVQPVHDDQQIVNYFEATAEGTGSTSVVRNAASEGTHGRYPESQTYLVTTDAEALDRANWIVAKQAEPFTRYGTLTINLYKMTASQVTTVINALDLNCWLRVTSMASQNPGGTVADVVVQGWSAAVTAEGWTVTCNVVAQSLYQVFLVGTSLLDDPAAPIYV